MMSKDFMQLSVVAAIIGCPIAYYLMQQFLDGYAYHIDLGWGIFIITVALITGLTLITVAFQVLRAAMANPVEALRNQ
jgi:putative ABC transport system permease protein